MIENDPTLMPNTSKSLSFSEESSGAVDSTKVMHERSNCRMHPYMLHVLDRVKILRENLSQQLCNTIYAEMIGASRTVADGENSESNGRLRSAFPGHNMILESADGFQIGVNRQFLAKKSRYFSVAFDGPFEPVVGILRFKSIAYIPLYNTLCFLQRLEEFQSADFPSNQTAPLNLKTALEILDTAAYLQMDDLLTVIAEIIVRSVTVSTLISVFRHTSVCYPQLGDRLWRILTWKFDVMVDSGHFLELCEDELLRLLNELALNLDIREESKVINRWLTVNDEDEQALRLRQLWNTSRLSEFGFLGRPRVPTTILLAHSGWASTGPTTIIEAFDKHRRKWVDLRGISLRNPPRAYHSLVSTSTHLYSIGGFNGIDYYDSMTRMNLRGDVFGNWEEMSHMGDKRCYLSTALLDDDHFIAIGGFDSEIRFRTAELYTVSKNLWEPISVMNTVRSDAHSVALDGKVYIIGGFDGINCHRTMELYVPERNEWLMTNNPMLYSRSGVKAVQIGGVIMVAGGFDGRRRLRNCEFYDPRIGYWYKLASMQTTRSNFGIEVFNCEVVVAGGYEGRTIVDQVESYDWRCNTWLPAPTLSIPRSALSLQTFDGLDVCQKFFYTENDN